VEWKHYGETETGLDFDVSETVISQEKWSVVVDIILQTEKQ
jgi:hypothetical protein